MEDTKRCGLEALEKKRLKSANSNGIFLIS